GEGRRGPAAARAAKFSAKSKPAADRQFLAQAFAAEKFSGVRVELAGMLGESGGDVCRHALIQGLQDADARVRRACLNQFGRFPKDAKVTEAIKSVLKNGDQSYEVEAGALVAYANQGHKDAVTLIQPWLSKPSHRDTLRAATLRALGSTGDLAILDTLLESAAPGHSRNSRTAALEGLGSQMQKAQPNEQQRKRILHAFSEALTSDSPFFRYSVLATLRGVGEAAKPLLPAVEKLSREDSMEFLRENARQTAEQIRGKSLPE